MTDEQVGELARDIVTNRVYVAWDEAAIHNSFGPMLALAHDAIKPIADKIGLVFEEYSKAMPMACNGYPTFLSIKFVHIDNVPALLSEVQRMAEALGLTEPADKEGTAP